MTQLSPAAVVAAIVLTLLALVTLWAVPWDVSLAVTNQETFTLWLRARFPMTLLACCGAALLPALLAGHLAGRHPAPQQAVVWLSMLAVMVAAYVLTARFAY